MKITVCIGSSCHIKGSRGVVETFQNLIAENGVGDRVELGGTFCLGHCQNGVSVELDGKIYSVTEDTAKEFFEKEVLVKLK